MKPKRPGASDSASATDSQASVAGNMAAGTGENAEDRKARKRAEAAIRQKLSPYRKKQAVLEKEMDRLQSMLMTLERDLSDPDLYADQGKHKLKELLGQQATAKSRLADVEAEWLEISETVEDLEAELTTS